MRAPVSLCVIVKNEELLADCLASFRDYVEEIVVVDTGSTDDGKTLNIITQYADKYELFTKCNNSETGLIEDFSMARQRAFDLATQPWVIWADADDKVEGAEKLLAITQAYTDKQPMAYSFPYQLYDAQGNVTLRFYRERLFFKPKIFHWEEPVHEVVVPTFDIMREDLLYKHQKKVTQESGRNLRILQKHYQKVGDKISPRMRFYLGRECADNSLNEDAIKHLTKYVHVGGWEDEQAMACIRLVELHQVKEDFSNALKWAFKAIELKETWCEGYFALGKTFYLKAVKDDSRRNWEKAVHFIRLGLQQPPTQTKLFINPMDREVDIHLWYNFALNKIGNVQGALNSCLVGLRKQPDNKKLLMNKKIYEDYLGANL